MSSSNLTDFETFGVLITTLLHRSEWNLAHKWSCGTLFHAKFDSNRANMTNCKFCGLPYPTSSRCAAKRHRTSRTTASLSLTPDGAVFARLTPMPSLFCEPTLGLKTGVFQWWARKYGTVFPLHSDSPDVELGQFQRLLKTFLFGEAAVH